MVVPPVHHSFWIISFDAVYNFAHSKWGVLTGAVSGTATVVRAWPLIWEKFERFRDFQSLKQRIGADLYTQHDLIWATRYYVEPECQLTDPAGQEDFRKLAPMRTSAHKALVNLLDEQSDQRFMIVLADSGMGKSTLLMNLYAKFGRKKGNYYLIPLGRPDVDELIKKVRHKTNSILFLDAFDEDTKAIKDYKARLAELVELSKDFSRIVMTCRTQFFETDAEIPQETGIIRIGAVSAGKSKTYTFSKLYLSPFSRRQIDRYLSKRFPIWQRGARKVAKEIVYRASDLTMRPMLLSHIPELVTTGKIPNSASDLYHEMTNAWFEREKRFVEPSALKLFSIAMALDIFCKREERGSESISSSEALLIAEEMSVPLQSWQFRGRSLLNRTGEGRLKFSHRSLLEYFFVLGFLGSENAVAKTVWTDQVKRFWWEKVASEFADNPHSGIGKYRRLNMRMWRARDRGDVTQMTKLGLKPFIEFPGVGPRNIETSPRNSMSNEESLGVLLVEKVEMSGEKIEMPHPRIKALGEQDCVIIDIARGISWHDVICEADPAAVISILSANYRRRWRLPTFEEVNTLRRIRDERITAYPTELFTEWKDTLWCDVGQNLRGTCCFNEDKTSCSLLDRASSPDMAYVRLVRTDHASLRNPTFRVSG